MSCAQPTLKPAAPVILDSNRVTMKQVARLLVNGLLQIVIVFSGCKTDTIYSDEKDNAVHNETRRSNKETIKASRAYGGFSVVCDPTLDKQCGHRIKLYAFALPGLNPISAHITTLPQFSQFTKVSACPYIRATPPLGPDIYYSFDILRGLVQVKESTITVQCSKPIALSFRVRMGKAGERRWQAYYKQDGKIRSLLFPIRDAEPVGDYHRFNRGRAIMLADRNGRIYLIRDLDRPRMEHLKEIVARADGDYPPMLLGDPESTSVFITTRVQENSRLKYHLMKIDPITGTNNYYFARDIGDGRPVFSKKFGMLITGEENDHFIRIIDPESGKIRHRVALPSNVSFYDILSLIGRPSNLQAIIYNRLVDLQRGRIVANIQGFDSEAKGGIWALSPSGRVLCWRMRNPDRSNPIGHLQFLHIQCYDLEQRRSCGLVSIEEIEKDPKPSFPVPHKIVKFIWADDNTLLAVVDL